MSATVSLVVVGCDVFVDSCLGVLLMHDQRDSESGERVNGPAANRRQNQLTSFVCTGSSL